MLLPLFNKGEFAVPYETVTVPERNDSVDWTIYFMRQTDRFECGRSSDDVT
jgi:hypothetical protein